MAKSKHSSMVFQKSRQTCGSGSGQNETDATKPARSRQIAITFEMPNVK